MPRGGEARVKLSDLTTLRIGGEVSTYVEARSEDELIAAVRAADAAGEELLVLGGGSNLVASSDPFKGTVVRAIGEDHPAWIEASCEVSTTGEARPTDRTPLAAACGGATVEYFAGTSWDAAVAYAVEREMVGIEALSGIPGTVGATPIQNVGAYGQEVSSVITRVRTWDRLENQVRTFFAAECQFAYRDSLFKRTRMPQGGATGRYVVLSVTFQHQLGSLSAPVKYAQLAERLGIRVGERAPMREVREAVLEVRARKGMVLDASDHDTWSAGSFFTNPILTREAAAILPEEAPRYEAEGGIKTSAAWLISHSGLERGFTLTPERSGAALSTKHSLALTNRGEATSKDIAELAEHVRSRVHESFGVWLEPEPVRLNVRIGA